MAAKGTEVVVVQAPPKVEVECRSMLLLHPIGDLLGDGDQMREYRVREGRGAWRALRAGDHVDPAHPLVQAYPDAWAPSAELPTTVLLEQVPEEVRQAQEADRRRRLPRHAELVRPMCENCGQSSDVEVVLPPQPQAIDVASALDAAEDLDERDRVAFQVRHLARAWSDAVKAREQALGDFKRQHALCPTDAELRPLPAPPPRPDGVPPRVWSGPFSLQDVGRY
jgi:hypothetical protein